MQYKCARAISVEKLPDNLILKTFSDKKRKGLTTEQWQQEMNHEIDMTKKALKYINCPLVLEHHEFSYLMTYCGEPITEIFLKDLIRIKNMERDLIHYGRIYHNDLKPENILKKNDNLYFIDFGHATVDKPKLPLLDYRSICSFDSLIWKKIDEEISSILCNTNAHGGRISYYGSDDKKGIRNWDKRWKILKNACDYTDKRILDLGCNQGMFASYIALYGNPAFVLGVDASKDIIMAADLTAFCMNTKAFFRCCNIAGGDTRNPSFTPTVRWQDVVGFDFDIVCALSLYYWVENKQELLDYLFNFPCVLMEAHSFRELDELINKFNIQNYRSDMVYQGSDNKYDRPIVRFTKY